MLELNAKSDLDIFNLAREKGSVILLSKDADFSELINRIGAPPKLINIKLGNCDNQTLWSMLKPVVIDAIKVLTSTDVSIVDVE